MAKNLYYIIENNIFFKPNASFIPANLSQQKLGISEGKIRNTSILFTFPNIYFRKIEESRVQKPPSNRNYSSKTWKWLAVVSLFNHMPGYCILLSIKKKCIFKACSCSKQACCIGTCIYLDRIAVLAISWKVHFHLTCISYGLETKHSWACWSLI